MIDYIDHSWHPIKEEQVIGLKHSVHYNTITTNRLKVYNEQVEKYQSKIKASDLKVF